METEKLEKMIRDLDSSKQAKQQLDSQPGSKTEAESSTLRTGPDISELNLSHYSRRPSRNILGWTPMILSASSAVITGILLGWLFMHIFPVGFDQVAKLEQGNEANTYPHADQIAQTDQILPETSDGHMNDDAGVPVLSFVQLPAEEYYFLQNGVFSSEQSAVEAQALLKEKGLASVIDSSDGFRVYAGFSLNRDDALFLSNKIQEQELETYIKTIHRPGVTMIEWPEESKDSFAAYITESSELIQIMNAWTSQLLRNHTTSIGNEQLTTLREKHQAWSNHAVNVTNAAIGDLGSHLGKMNAFLNTAIESFAEYAKHPDESYLWQAQTAMMQFIILENDLIHQVIP